MEENKIEEKLKYGSGGMIHLNGNLLCVIDVETSGLDPIKQDIIQICILPLDSQIKPRRDITPFYMYIKPRQPENIDWEAITVNRFKMSEIMLNGIDSDRAVDLLEEWFEKLKLGFNKRISPLAQNWVFDQAFIKNWTGPKMFEYIFDGRYRDTMTSALYANDKAYFMGEAFPYQKVNLRYLASTLEVQYERAHDAMSDCMVTAEIYRRMLMNLI